MSTKKWIALVILIVTLIVALAAAYVIAREDIYQTDRTPVSTTDPEPTATPESPEEPEPSLVACVGGETDETFRSAVNAVKDIDLLDAAMEQLSDMSVDAVVLYVDGPLSGTDDAALDALLVRGVPVLAYNRAGVALPDGVTVIAFETNAPATAKEALEAAIVYPPHDTPVRLFGLFESEESEAAQVWNEAVSAGRVLSKGVYSADKAAKEGSVTEWLGKKLERYYPGMVDAAFAETPALAAEAAALMEQLGRDDFEIFTVGSSVELSALAAKLPRILPASSDIDAEKAAAAVDTLLTALLAGETPTDVLLKAE